ncbi:response regulator transcription factor [Angustibacter sp. Root456]|uniref:response regulator transcription factor n=1 Tax=Angustibacter sp. Root456 TaxID=1736539 RepID=UPI0006F9BC1D|nr:response regulator transcription factor [Angustibacter sp. Root456]KQX64516.1 PhoR family transcriptional regulator [Angustibacter sp. Root456]
MSQPSGRSAARPLTERQRRVLVVDDEQPLVTLVAGYLERDGFEVSTAHDGGTALELARTADPDVVVLDLGLPVVDGVEVCRRLRTFSDCYVVMLTARAEEVDKLIGLSVGADDYMTKPFSPRELVARIHVMLRRPRLTTDPLPPLEEQPPRVIGGLVLDLAGHEVHLDGEPVPLTPTEFDLLATLAGRPKLAFTRRQLIDAVWGETWVGDEHLVDVHVAHLRRKLGDDPAAPRFVRTVRGVGYRLGTGT